MKPDLQCLLDNCFFVADCYCIWPLGFVAQYRDNGLAWREVLNYPPIEEIGLDVCRIRHPCEKHHSLKTWRSLVLFQHEPHMIPHMGSEKKKWPVLNKAAGFLKISHRGHLWFVDAVFCFWTVYRDAVKWGSKITVNKFFNFPSTVAQSLSKFLVIS